MNRVLQTLLLLFLFNNNSYGQTSEQITGVYEIRLTSSGGAVIDVQMRCITAASCPETTSFIADITFAIKWLSSYNVDLSTPSSTYGVIKSGSEIIQGSYEYQIYQLNIAPFFFPEDWNVNSWYSIASINVSQTGSGVGTFQISEFGFNPSSDPNLNVDGDDYFMSPSGAAIGVSLPVKLTRFQTEAKDADALLSWQTESEHNLSHYDIERSTDQRNWQNIGKVDGKGDTYTSANYQWTDAGALRNATGEYLYYRLKMVDTDASSEYSPIRSVRVLKSVKTVHVQPNPATNALYIAYDSDEAAAITVSLYDNTGKLVLLTTYKSGMPVDVSALPRGVYSLQLTDRSTVLATERVVLQ